MSQPEPEGDPWLEGIAARWPSEANDSDPESKLPTSQPTSQTPSAPLPEPPSLDSALSDIPTDWHLYQLCEPASRTHPEGWRCTLRHRHEALAASGIGPTPYLAVNAAIDALDQPQAQPKQTYSLPGPKLDLAALLRPLTPASEPMRRRL